PARRAEPSQPFVQPTAAIDDGPTTDLRRHDQTVIPHLTASERPTHGDLELPTRTRRLADRGKHRGVWSTRRVLPPPGSIDQRTLAMLGLAGSSDRVRHRRFPANRGV